MIARFVWLVVAATSLSACAATPDVIGQSDDQITLRWFSDEDNFADAQRAAIERCAPGSEAALVGTWTDGPVTIAQFACALTGAGRAANPS
jgi:hypothetical protein